MDDRRNAPARPLPHPQSLCHRCAAPPRYVETKTSVFIQCPIAPMKYPPQPVARCDFFRERTEEPDPGRR